MNAWRANILQKPGAGGGGGGICNWRGERETATGNFMLSYHRPWESRKFHTRHGD